MTGLTPKQADVLQALRDLSSDGVPPSYDELTAHLGLASKGHLRRLLDRLKARGKVDWKPRAPRSLYIVEDQVAPAVLHRLSDEALRSTLTYAAGILCQRMGAIQAQQVLNRIADRLPGAPRRVA